MCGIAGYAGWTQTRASATDTLGAMCAAIRHRGPNDEGHFVRQNVALGMRRLSVIDVEGGAQPLSNEAGDVSIVFNGEIYNHRELRRELVARGHKVVTRSDTECIVHRYEEVGDRVVDDLRGMFGFAIWDERRERLLIARDRLGIKPLYYWEYGGRVAFASELRSLLAFPDFPRTIDPKAVAYFLAFGYVPDPMSIFAHVRKLEPGHRMTWTRDEGVRIEQYWSAARISQTSITRTEASEELRRLIAESVNLHLESDVPLGAFLSGGIDSSTVVAQMARLMSQPVRTFSIGFAEREFNEAPHAAAVAKAIGTEHTELIVRPDADSLVEDVVRSFDEPFSDPSALPTYLVSHLARQHVTVALSGDGGDELFGGYTRYMETLRRTDLASPVRGLIGAVASQLPQVTPGRNRLLDIARTRRGRYASTVASSLAVSEGGIARPEIASLAPALDTILDPWFGSDSDRDFVAQMGLVDLQTYLPGDILTKVDRMSMSVSLEARVPLLDHKVVEFALSLPSELKIRDGVGKWILRDAISDLVPPTVLSHPKQGFAVPLAAWFRRELRHRVDRLLEPNARVHEYTDVGAVRRLAQEHRVGRRDHSWLLWRTMVLDLWLGSLARGDLSQASPFVDASPASSQRVAAAR